MISIYILFDVDPNTKTYYRMHSTDVDNDNYIRRITESINLVMCWSDIKLDSKLETVYDKMEINLK